jgi:hypothetical protein
VRTRWTLRILAREGGILHPHRVLLGSSLRSVPDPFEKVVLAEALAALLAVARARRRARRGAR